MPDERDRLRSELAELSGRIAEILAATARKPVADLMIGFPIRLNNSEAGDDQKAEIIRAWHARGVLSFQWLTKARCVLEAIHVRADCGWSVVAIQVTASESLAEKYRWNDKTRLWSSSWRPVALDVGDWLTIVIGAFPEEAKQKPDVGAAVFPQAVVRLQRFEETIPLELEQT